MFSYNFNFSRVYIRLKIFAQCLLLLRQSNLLVAQHLICSTFPSHKQVFSMLPLVFILIENVHSNIRTCRWLAGFKVSGEVIFQPRWLTKEKIPELGMDPGKGCGGQDLVAYWRVDSTGLDCSLCSSSALRCSWKGRVLWTTQSCDLC